jgi:putative restriction endonuclease
VKSKNWTPAQLKLAFHLYCQLPFGKLHKSNAEIIHLAQLIGRTPSAVAMKLVNFASLDPAITNSGRKGLDGASLLDREIWNEFHADWEKLAVECEVLRRNIDSSYDDVTFSEPEDFSGETRKVLTEQRIKQTFFRHAVLSSYNGRCCMSGVSDSRLLVASHIVPWSKDKKNRLNPSNGLCLSSLHDKAFDKGLISLTDDFRILIARELHESKDAFLQATLNVLAGQKIELPMRFQPSNSFLAQHRSEVFLGE